MQKNGDLKKEQGEIMAKFYTEDLKFGNILFWVSRKKLYISCLVSMCKKDNEYHRGNRNICL